MRRISAKALALLMAVLFGFTSLDVSALAAEVTAESDEDVAENSAEVAEDAGEVEYINGTAVDGSTQDGSPVDGSPVDGSAEDEKPTDATQVEDKSTKITTVGQSTGSVYGNVPSSPIVVENILDAPVVDTSLVTKTEGVYVVDWQPVSTSSYYDEDFEETYYTNNYNDFLYVSFTPEVSGTYTFVYDGFDNYNEGWMTYDYFNAWPWKTLQVSKQSSDYLTAGTTYYFEFRHEQSVEASEDTTSETASWFYVCKGGYPFDAYADDEKLVEEGGYYSLSTSVGKEVTLKLDNSAYASDFEGAAVYYNWYTDYEETSLSTNSSYKFTVGEKETNNYYCDVTVKKNGFTVTSTYQFNTKYSQTSSSSVTSIEVNGEKLDELTSTTFFPKKNEDFTISITNPVSSLGDKAQWKYSWEWFNYEYQEVEVDDEGNEIYDDEKKYTTDTTYTIKAEKVNKLKYNTLTCRLTLYVNDGSDERSFTFFFMPVNSVSTASATASELNPVSHLVEKYKADSSREAISDGYVYAYDVTPITFGISFKKDVVKKFSSYSVLIEKYTVDGNTYLGSTYDSGFYGNTSYYETDGNYINYVKKFYDSGTLLSTGTHTVTVDAYIVGTDSSGNKTYIDLGESGHIEGTVTVNTDETLASHEATTSQTLIASDSSSKINGATFSFYADTKDNPAVETIEVYKSSDNGTYTSDTLVGTGSVKSTNFGTEKSNWAGDFGDYKPEGQTGVSVAYSKCIINTKNYYSTVTGNLTIDKTKFEGISTPEKLDVVITLNDGSKYYAKNAVTFDDGSLETTSKVVTFDANGGAFDDGDSSTNVTYTKGSKYGTMPTPVKEGYRFTGYTSDAEGTKTVTKDSVVSSTGNYETVYAQWTPYEATIVYNANGGNGKAVKQTIKYGQAFTLKSNDADTKFTKAASTFAGWGTLANSSEVTYKAADLANEVTLTGFSDNETINLYAKWTTKTYTIYLHKGNDDATEGTLTPGGKEAGVDESKDDAYALTLSYGDNLYLTGREFSLDGKTISGWAKTATGKVAYKNGTVSGLTATLEKAGNTSMDLYAVWSTGKYNITYSLGTNGKCKGVTSYTYSTTKDTTLTVPTKTGYKFDYWTVSGDALDSLKEIEGAVGEANKLTATVTTKKSTVTVLPKGTEGDITLTAHWTPISYTVKFDATDKVSETLTDVVATYEGNDSDSVAIKSLTTSSYAKTGYTLTGYSTAKNGKGTKLTALLDDGTYSLAGLSTKDGATVTIYPIFKIDTYTITYELDGGSAAKNTTSYNVNTKKVSIKNPTKTGWTFTGWDVTSGTITSPTVDSKTKALSFTKGNTGNLTLTARWTSAGNYTVKINPNGGKYYTDEGYSTDVITFDTVSPDGKSTDTGNVVYISGSKFYKPSTGDINKGTYVYYVLKGLNTAKNGKGIYAASTTSNGTTTYTLENLKADSKGVVTLYAIWEKKTVNITYTTNPAGLTMTNKNPSTIKYDSQLTLKNPSVKGYVFGGWYDSLGAKVTGKTANLYTDTTYTAKFTPITYTIKINPNGATNLKTTYTESATYDTALDLSSYNTTYKRTGYIFKGFSTGKSGKTLDASAVKNLTTKANASVNLYAIWEKASTSKVSKLAVSSTDDGIYVSYAATKGTVTRYEVQYATTPNMSDAVLATLDTATATSVIIPAISLTSGKTYYIRVREVKVDSYGDTINGAWSDMKTIKF